MTPRDFFGPPAIPPPVPYPPAPTVTPTVSATVTGSLRLGGRGRVVEVDVSVAGLTFTTLVRMGRVVVPFYRGAEAIRFTDATLRLHVYRAAMEAAENAEARGWLR